MDLARALRDRFNDLPILLMTGFSSAGSSAQEEGFEVLGKPFSLNELAAWVRETLGDRPGVATWRQGIRTQPEHYISRALCSAGGEIKLRSEI